MPWSTWYFGGPYRGYPCYTQYTHQVLPVTYRVLRRVVIRGTLRYSELSATNTLRSPEHCTTPGSRWIRDCERGGKIWGSLFSENLLSRLIGIRGTNFLVYVELICSTVVSTEFNKLNRRQCTLDTLLNIRCDHQLQTKPPNLPLSFMYLSENETARIHIYDATRQIPTAFHPST